MITAKDEKAVPEASCPTLRARHLAVKSMLEDYKDDIATKRPIGSTQESAESIIYR